MLLVTTTISARAAALNQGNVFACAGFVTLTPLACSEGLPASQISNGPAQFTNLTLGSVGDGVVLTGSAYSNANYGLLRSEADASYDIMGPAKTAWFEAASVSQDSLTINSTSLNGQQGFLVITYALDGTSSSTGSGDALATVQFVVGNNIPSAQNYRGTINGTFNTGTAFSFTYGQPFNFIIVLEAIAGTPNFALGTATGLGTGSSDFSRTLILNGLEPFDSNGVPAIDATFSSESGAGYTTDGVVPEPTTASLALLGIGAILVIRKLVRV